jgi:hypothetical protein
VGAERNWRIRSLQRSGSGTYNFLRNGRKHNLRAFAANLRQKCADAAMMTMRDAIRTCDLKRFRVIRFSGRRMSMMMMVMMMTAMSVMVSMPVAMMGAMHSRQPMLVPLVER